jgi:hypothetical protein
MLGKSVRHLKNKLTGLSFTNAIMSKNGKLNDTKEVELHDAKGAFMILLNFVKILLCSFLFLTCPCPGPCTRFYEPLTF